MSWLADLARGQGQDARQARRTLKRRAAAAAGGSSDADDFAPLIEALDGFASNASPAAQGRTARDIAADLRNVNAKRLRANVQPSGEPMTPRKRKASGGVRTKRLRDEASATRGAKRSVRQGRMFARAADPKYLRKESSQGAARVGFVGAMARIMSVHHYGLRDTVTRDAASPAVTYPERQVLGMTPDDRLRILERVVGGIAG